MISNRDGFLVDFENPKGKLKQDEKSFNIRFLTTTHSRYSLRTEKTADAEFQRLLKGSSEVIKVIDELHDIDKMTVGEFSKMDRKDSSETIHQLGLPIPSHRNQEVESNFRKLGTMREGTRQFQSSHSSSFLFHPVEVLEDSPRT